MQSYTLLLLDDMRVALPLSCVERTERAVHVTRLPSAPEIVIGVVNVHGSVIPVIDMRRRFRLPPRDIRPSDRLVIARTRLRPLALVVDAVSGVVECNDIAEAGAIVPGLEFLDGVARCDDGLVLIHDLDRFLSLAEDEALSTALAVAGDP